MHYKKKRINMMSEYKRSQQEKQIEEELKWLEMEQGYVQGTINSTTRKPRETVSDKGKRDSNNPCGS